MTTLLVTNDFPPTVGGIQSYLHDFVATQDPSAMVVFASTQDPQAARELDAGAPYRTVRWPRSIMLPTPATAEAMSWVIRECEIDTVWFGASAPLGLMASAARRAGAQRIVVSTHGHEVGWAKTLPGRAALRRIGNSADVVTYISDYTQSRLAGAFGSRPKAVRLPSGVDTDFFSPASPEQRHLTRQAWGWGDRPVITCVSRLVARKGQDRLIDALPEIRVAHPGAVLVIVGSGPAEAELKRRAGDGVVFAAELPRAAMRDVVAASDVMAMPARTRLGGFDVEGLGIVYLEAQACGVPVVAGDSGGAPEAVGPGAGVVVDGRDRRAIAKEIISYLDDAARRAEAGRRGRQFVQENHSWKVLGERLSDALQSGGTI
ncbi:glycosyltransferase family 4 protein [Corynebacterium uterequi]|uniref:Glycosyltransferase n=1 Tax=Corynebacterium uterequi TaxID=1072256 RepID=A0A0G3HDU6_9CORY|nr:glycosyltransferase family 4 protein [Corynebacterium uterequi]AKK11489.1 glycosyltransferase [Corynebacterium uterequi]